MEKSKITKKRLLLFIAAFTFLVCVGIIGIFSLKREKIPENVKFAVLPDTQIYSEKLPIIFDAQTEWIAENAAQEEIDFVLHVGDIVNNPFNDTQWVNACNSMKKLEDAGIPYIVAVGNHDVDYKLNLGDMHAYYDDIRPSDEKFLTYFPKEKFQDMPTYGKHSENGYNQYHFVECGDYKILVLALDWLPSAETMKWVEKLLQKYDKYPTVIVKHDFIKPRGEESQEELPVLSGEETKGQWELFRKYNQIFMVVNGHLGTDHGILQNDVGNDVFLSSADFQSESRGGNGMMQTIELNFEEGSIDVETFSPYVMQIEESKRRETDVERLVTPKGCFRQEYDLKTRFTEIGQ